MVSKEYLDKAYLIQQKSVSVIARELKCSENKVTYWLRKHGIQKRTISDALYIKHNPKGDPFTFRKPLTSEQFFLFGLGIGCFGAKVTKLIPNQLDLGILTQI